MRSSTRLRIAERIGHADDIQWLADFVEVFEDLERTRR